MTQKIKIEINCRRKETVRAAVQINEEIQTEGICAALSEEAVSGCRLMRIRLDIPREVPLDQHTPMTIDRPIRVFVPADKIPEKITALYMYGPWWTRPAFVCRLADIPDRTQVALLKYTDRCVCIVPMTGSRFKTCISGGTDNEICFEMTACAGGIDCLEEPLYIYSEAPTAAEAVQKAFAYLTEINRVSSRTERRIPEMFRYLGWCSWDACYTDVSEDIIRSKAAELKEKNISVRWMLIDDGWFPSRNKMISGFAPDNQKFPEGFRKMTEEIRENTDIRWFGVWYALGGYWAGIDPESQLAQDEKPYLHTNRNGVIIPDHKNGSGFYRDWCDLLKREGIDFIKVDGQSSAPFYYEDEVPVCEAARGLNESLESGAYRMDGAIINCMGMAMENILARPNSAISRNSDDFLPAKEESFAEHLLQNAYNSIYHNEVYCCDWDMFWTDHRHAVKHSLLRAISGGPVYVSDKVGATDPEVLKPLAYADGKLLMMNRSARPTEDCVFTDPLTEGVFKLQNTGKWGVNRTGGGIAAYNLTGKEQVLTFSPSDVQGIDLAPGYWIYDYFDGKVFRLGRTEKYSVQIEGDGFRWYVIIPEGRNGSCLGLIDKYAGFTAVESISETDNAQIAVLWSSGRIAWASDKAPSRVFVNAEDMTECITGDDGLYILNTPEKTERTVITIIW